MTIRLITIPFSHYCEKARWALDRCGIAFREDGHLPLFHYLATYSAGGGRTVPVVVDGKTVLRDSTDIVAWADARAPATLLPADPAVRADALALEDDFDRQLGPATRRWGYFQLLPNREVVTIISGPVPRWQMTALRVGRRPLTALLARGLAVTPEGAARSQRKIDAAFATVGDRLRDGRRYLAGDAFSVADLTFAALAGPVLQPRELPAGAVSLDVFPPAGRDQAEAWRATPAGQFALRIYADERALSRRA